MSKLERKKINALPKATGSLSAKTTRWPATDPRSTIATSDVFVGDTGSDFYDVGGRVEQNDYFTSVIIELPKNIQSGVHKIGAGGIDARYYVAVGEDEEYYRAISGEIDLSVSDGYFEAKEFRFAARVGSAGTTAEVYMGSFKISR
ncbi:hypothetical protein [Pseudomonas sp.]|jgi:hypothetical protein|uniref:hypothetical protein n=1 Tax=unclassified Pseudomonas TaxID=196821 RepID=UPI003D10554D